MRLVFVAIATAVTLLAAMVSADAVCFDKNGEKYPAIAVADASGAVTVSAPTGGTMRIGGFAPGAEVCRNLLFRSAIKKCPDGEAVFDANRNPRFCEGVSPGQICVHIRCNGKRGT